MIKECFMEETRQIFLRYISTIYRNTNRYLDTVLEREGLGSGQQFFLTYIYERQGITMYDLAKYGNFDKGTITKAVQKLKDMGYVEVETDLKDKRVRHLYVTDRAREAVERVYEARARWKEQISEGLSGEEIERLSAVLEKMEKNSCAILKEQQR